MDDAIKHGLSDFRVKRRLTVDHTLHLTLLKIYEEGNSIRNLQMNREKLGHNDEKYTTTSCIVKIKLIPYLVNFHAGFLVRASRHVLQTRLKKCTNKYIS